jgi:hypothetical protein
MKNAIKRLVLIALLGGIFDKIIAAALNIEIIDVGLRWVAFTDGYFLAHSVRFDALNAAILRFFAGRGRTEPRAA